MQEQNRLQKYLDIVRKVAKVEHRRIPSHMVEYEELLSIGIIAIQGIIANKTAEQLENYNIAYIATAVRWAIRNELRIRYKWYSLKHTSDDEVTPEEEVEGMDMQKAKIRAKPDEQAEITELGRMIRAAISKLPPKERTVVEYRFYRNMQVKDIATQIGLSPSRVTRIVQSSLNFIKEYLNNHEQYDY